VRHQLAVWLAAATTVVMTAMALEGRARLAVLVCGALWLLVPHQRVAAAAAAAVVAIVLSDRQWGHCGEKYEALVAVRLGAALALVEVSGLWIKRSPLRAAEARTMAALIVLAAAAITRAMALLPLVAASQRGGLLVELVARQRLAGANVGLPLDDPLPVWLAGLQAFPALVSAGVALVGGLLLAGAVVALGRRWPMLVATGMVGVTWAAGGLWSLVGADPADIGVETMLWATWGIVVAAAVKRDRQYPAPPV